MAFNPMVIGNSTPTSKSHMAFFHALATDGILAGCAFSNSGNTVNMGAGYINCGGAEIQATGTNSISVTGSSGYARIKGVIDLTKTYSGNNFNQFALAVDYSATLDGFAELTQEDIIAGAGTKYECALAVCQLGASGIAKIIPYKVQPKLQSGAELPASGFEGEIFFMEV